MNLCGKKLCVNHLNSYSGCISLKNKIFHELNQINNKEIDLNSSDDIRLFFNPDVTITGSHRESIRHVKEKVNNVDVAAIDCITYQLILKYAPEELNGITCIGKTSEALIPPFVTRREYVEKEGLYSILCDAFENTLSCNLGDAFKSISDMYELRNALDALYIKEFQIINPEDYKKTFSKLNIVAKHIKFYLWKEKNILHDTKANNNNTNNDDIKKGTNNDEGEKNISSSPGVNEFNPQLSEDGTTLVFLRQSNKAISIVTMPFAFFLIHKKLVIVYKKQIIHKITSATFLTTFDVVVIFKNIMMY